MYSEIPLDFTIGKAYPNPFNPTINLSYENFKSEKISVEVYDIKGRLIKSLINRLHAPGKYQIVWDASNVSSGIYMIHYKTDSKSLKQKISLLK